jgi:hypothetical protein
MYVRVADLKTNGIQNSTDFPALTWQIKNQQPKMALKATVNVVMVL